MPIDFEFSTRRLTVRPIRAADFASCQATKNASVLSPDEANGKTLAVSQNDRKAFGRMVQARRRLMAEDRGYFFGVFTRPGGRFVGEVMLYDVERGDRQNATIGAVICSRYRGRGYGTEAVKALLRHAFTRLGLHRVDGEADPHNEASIAMCTKAGMRIECVSRRRVRADGRWKDQVILAVTSEEL